MNKFKTRLFQKSIFTLIQFLSNNKYWFCTINVLFGIADLENELIVDS